MRILRLYIARHLILRDLDLRFDRRGRIDTGAYALDFLVGVNGSGKSTVLRTLAQIINDLHAGRPTEFEYTLTYELHRREEPEVVTITRERSTTSMVVRQGDVDGPVIVEPSAVDITYLPKRVVVHTTGNESSWASLQQKMAQTIDPPQADESLLTDAAQRSIVELPGHLPRQETAEAEEGESPYLLIRESRLPITTLCGLLANLTQGESAPLSEVLDSLELAGLAGFSLRFRLHSRLSDMTVFEKLRPLATRYVRQGNDHLLVFNIPEPVEAAAAFADSLLKPFENALGLFDALDQQQELSPSGEPTLQQINLFLQRNAVQTEAEEAVVDEMSHLLLLEWLSDGERSFLGRMALLAMLDTDDSLILLDEPEVHFNDYWKREIVKLLDTVMRNHSNHLLIVSHSSIALSDVTEAQIMVLQRPGGGFTTVQTPGLKTFGTDPSEIMVVLFRTDLSVGALAAQLLETAVKSGDQEELQNFLNRVGPGMWRFRLRDRLEGLNAPST